ncbi:hypothetical protein LEMLEM_LOCUS22016 [Lemmus lemmus]
MSEVQECISHN